MEFHVPNVIRVDTVNAVISLRIVVRIRERALVDILLAVNSGKIGFDKLIISLITKNPVISVRIGDIESFINNNIFRAT